MTTTKVDMPLNQKNQAMVVSDKASSMGQIEPFDYLQTNNWCQIKLLVLHSNTWNHLNK